VLGLLMRELEDVESPDLAAWVGKPLASRGGLAGDGPPNFVDHLDPFVPEVQVLMTQRHS